MECRSSYKPGDMFASIDKHYASDPNAPADGAGDDFRPVPLEQPHNGSGDAPGHHLPNHAPVGGYGTMSMIVIIWAMTTTLPTPTLSTCLVLLRSSQLAIQSTRTLA